MSQHLKSRIIRRLKAAVSYYPPHADISASHARGVRYFVPVTGIDALWGAMNTVKEGRHYKKHIIVRRVPRRGGQLMQLYPSLGLQPVSLTANSSRKRNAAHMPSNMTAPMPVSTGISASSSIISVSSKAVPHPNLA